MLICVFSSSRLGANQIELADGRIIKLEKLSTMERAGKAKLLLSNPGIKVHRHLIDGDVLLVNRQPTLHTHGDRCTEQGFFMQTLVNTAIPYHTCVCIIFLWSLSVRSPDPVCLDL